jgi:ubiquinone/menaquinone biosynthesis C-methylase UbiE
MDSERKGDNEQAAFWNGAAACAWVEAQELMDTMFTPIETMLVQAVSTEHDQRVLDVGCGTGSTTLAASRQLGTKGHCVGIDISEPMIDTAQDRAKREGLTTTFLCGDAQRHAFEPASFDLIMSRFGVMFFDDFVGAFKNLRQAARKNAELRLIVWRSAEENPFMTTAERAAMALLPNMPARRPDEPGQFAFAKESRIFGILQESGWAAIHIEPVDFTCTFPESELLRYLARMGPLGRVLQNEDEQTRKRVVEAVRPAFDPYVHGDAVRFVAACWKISAQAL